MKISPVRLCLEFISKHLLSADDLADFSSALDRIRSISAFSFTEFAIVKATDQQGE